MENEKESEETVTTGTAAVKKVMPGSIKAALWGIGVYVFLSIVVMVLVVMQGNTKGFSSGISLIIWVLIAVGLGQKSRIAWWGALIFSILGMAGIGAAIFIGKNVLGLYQVVLALAYWAPLIVVIVAINRKTAKEYVK